MNWRSEGVEPLDPSFVDEFNVSQEYAVLVFHVRRAAVSLPAQAHRLEMLVEAGLTTSSNACFEFADEGQDSLARHPCEPSDDFCQPSSQSFKS